jgi:hypothetical protein
MTDILPAERRSAEEAQKLLQAASRLIAATYSELARYQEDSDRVAAERAYEALGAATGALASARDLMRALS